MPDTHVMLVEDESTAVIAYHCIPQYAWLAVGDIGICDAEMFQPLFDREVIIMARLCREDVGMNTEVHLQKDDHV